MKKDTTTIKFELFYTVAQFKREINELKVQVHATTNYKSELSHALAQINGEIHQLNIQGNATKSELLAHMKEETHELKIQLSATKSELSHALQLAQMKVEIYDIRLKVTKLIDDLAQGKSVIIIEKIDKIQNVVDSIKDNLESPAFKSFLQAILMLLVNLAKIYAKSTHLGQVLDVLIILIKFVFFK